MARVEIGDVARSWIRPLREIGPAVFAIICVFVAASPIRGSGYLADDVPNSQWPVSMRSSGQSFLGAVAWAIDQWKTHEGRFYPASAFESILIFTVFADRASYKTVQWLLVGAAFVLVGLFVGFAVRSVRWGVLASLLAVSAMQFRAWFDPYMSFGGLLPSLAVKVLSGSILLLWGVRRWPSGHRWTSSLILVAGSLLWVYAMLQYEIAILMVLPLMAVVLIEPSGSLRLRSLAILPATVAAVFLCAYSLTLRSGVVNSPAYSISVAPDRVIPAFAYQSFGGLPGSVTAMKANGAPGFRQAVDAISVVGWLAIGLIAALIAWSILTTGIPRVRARIQVAVFGVGLVVLPALPIAVSSLRQSQLGWGNAYLPVLLQVLGFGVLATVVIIEIRRVLGDAWDRSAAARLPRATKSWCARSSAITLGLCVALLIAIAHVNNDWAVAVTKSWRVEQNAVDAAKHSRFFDKFDGSSFVSGIDAVGFGWLNSNYLADGTSLRIATFDSVPVGYRTCDGGLCTASGDPIYMADVVPLGSANALLVARLESVDQAGSPIIVGSSLRALISGETPSACQSTGHEADRSNWNSFECPVADGSMAAARIQLGGVQP